MHILLQQLPCFVFNFLCDILLSQFLISECEQHCKPRIESKVFGRCMAELYCAAVIQCHFTVIAIRQKHYIHGYLRGEPKSIQCVDACWNYTRFIPFCQAL